MRRDDGDLSRRRGRSWLARNRVKVLIVVALAGALGTDLAATAFINFVQHGTISPETAEEAMRVRSPFFHHGLAPNAEATDAVWGRRRYTLTTNSLGFKDRAIREVPLSSNRYRILFIGDSFTEGVGFAYDQTFVGIIDRALAPAGIEVLNAGVVTYSPTTYWKKVEFLLNEVRLRFDLLVVFLDIADIPDEAIEYDLRGGSVVALGPERFGIGSFLAAHSTLARRLWSYGVGIQEALCDPDMERSKWELRFGTNFYRSRWTFDQAVYADYAEVGLEKAKTSMNALHALVEKHGIEMALVVYPWPDQVLHRESDSLQVRIWRKWAEAHSGWFVDLFPAFIQPDQDPKEVLSKYFIPVDYHWNRWGHELVAESFLEKWRTRPAGIAPISRAED